MERLSREELEQRMRESREAVQENVIVNLPNVISAIRMGLAPVLVWLALKGEGDLFLVILAVSIFTDAFDGYLARKFDQVTELGAQLDSWADVITYAVMLLGLWQIWPEIFAREDFYLLLAFSGWLVPLLVCLARFRKFPSFHTLGAKLAALCLTPTYFVAAIWDYSLPFRAVLLFYLLVALEQVIITVVLPHWQSNVSSLRKAVRIAREAHRDGRADT